MLVSVWDDEYGISVPKEYQTTKGSISKILAGFQRNETEKGFEIFTVNGWDYQELCKVYEKAEKICREDHVPVLVHVKQMTQPQGHSTSGSHERYKSKERLSWEAEHDCIRKFREWIVEQGISNTEELSEIEKQAKASAKSAKEQAWKYFNADIQRDRSLLDQLLETASESFPEIGEIRNELKKVINPLRMDSMIAAKRSLRILSAHSHSLKQPLVEWIQKVEKENEDLFSSHLYSNSEWSALKVKPVPAVYSDSSPLVDGREVLQACFREALQRDPRVLAFGEDVGKIGDVNQGFAGLQAKFGEARYGSVRLLARELALRCAVYAP
jgi:2-oxoisovalerate dehydrogenase E1 component